MQAPDEAREAPEAERIAGHQFDPVAGEPQNRDGFARGQAGAFARQDFRFRHGHAVQLRVVGEKDKALAGSIDAVSAATARRTGINDLRGNRAAAGKLPYPV